MFGVTRSGASNIRSTLGANVRICMSGLARVALRRQTGRAAQDVHSRALTMALIETKSAETDPCAIQQSVCQQFHWLFARQILFRRRQMH